MSKVDIHKKICEELNALYARKNADYGDSFTRNYNEFGIVYPIMHFQEKLDRLKSLMTKDAQVADESITDTLMDLANYSIMTLVEMRHPVTKFTDALTDMAQAAQVVIDGGSVEKVEHDSVCKMTDPHCLCNSCARDRDACCSDENHLPLVCPMTACPDYVPEEG